MELTTSMEDYLETIYELMREKEFARVRDIARKRRVKPGSVTPAMKRLADLGLITYLQREYIGLTPTGLREARRVFSKHRVLTRFFLEVLALSPEEARQNACAIEHSLTPNAMDKLVRFFELLGTCQACRHNTLDLFHSCSLVHDDIPECEHSVDMTNGRRLVQLLPGESGKVVKVGGTPEIRRKLLNTGILPRTAILLEWMDEVNDHIRAVVDGFTLSLTIEEAKAIRIEDESLR